MQNERLKELIRSFLAGLPRPCCSMPVETEQDERL